MQTTTIATVLDKIINQQQLPLEQVIERYFSPAYRQRTNGIREDREGFTQHAGKLREISVGAKIDVLDELRTGPLYATRHRVLCTKRDGTEVLMEVYMFAELDDAGRFLRIEETTLMLEGSEGDRHLGSAK
ncbi:nuclear transport factor 2 family protein [Kosakonia sp. SMBL-WEM22]|uniref:nuclear transport factor 2 family protein n=1 Tax=Kosakonia sp. SMBL-WEM22 TaxID=2725560 RepID=UPI0016590F65|nr:nuclear transport factor 2 family protein [Kosakonia sp. SMBL-WEM22]QNQ21280.1 nuclear transport factor 2 family protein [Kosakonia sp. SMBL-WEM22]